MTPNTHIPQEQVCRSYSGCDRALPQGQASSFSDISDHAPQDQHGPYRGAEQDSHEVIELPDTVEATPVLARSAAGRGGEESPGTNSTNIRRAGERSSKGTAPGQIRMT